MLGGQPHVSFCLPLIRRPDIHLQISESPGQKCRFKMGKVIEHPRNYKAVLLWFDYTTSAVLFQVPFPGSRRNFFKMPPRSRPRFSLLFGRGRRFRFCSVAGCNAFSRRLAKAFTGLPHGKVYTAPSGLDSISRLRPEDSPGDDSEASVARSALAP